MRILIICTSPREGSQSLQFSNYLKNLFEAQPEVKKVNLIDFENFDIPTFGRGKIDPNKLSAFQFELVSLWKQSDLVVFVSPEYNWTTNGEVFIMFDQLGNKHFEHLFDNRVFACVGVSSGRGGRQAAQDVAKVVGKLISFQNKYSIISSKIFEAHDTGKNILENYQSAGNLIFEAGVDNFVQYTLKIAHKWVNTSSSN